MAKRILVVDDDDDIREVAQASLSLIGGWDVSTAASGREALSHATKQGPDAILLDVMMPDMDGPATLESLRQNPATAQIPVIFLTAKVQSADRARLTGLGATALLPKPFDPMQLPVMVADSLGWPS